jgi:hypothetical protein
MRLCVYPLGVRSTRFAGPACAELPGRDSTLERRSPEAKGGVLSIEICLCSPLGERSARAFGIAIPWHDPATCGVTAMPRSHDAMPIRMSASKRSAVRHLAFSDPAAVAFAPAGRRVCPFRMEPRVTRRPRRLPPGGERRRLVASVFLNHPRAPPLLHGSTLAESTTTSARFGSELLIASGSEGLTSSPTGVARASPSVRLASASGDRQVEAEHLVVARAWIAIRRYREPCASLRMGRASAAFAREREPHCTGALACPGGKLTESLEKVCFRPRGLTVVQCPAKEQSHPGTSEVPPAAPPSGEGCPP